MHLPSLLDFLGTRHGRRTPFIVYVCGYFGEGKGKKQAVRFFARHTHTNERCMQPPLLYTLR